MPCESEEVRARHAHSRQAGSFDSFVSILKTEGRWPGLRRVDVPYRLEVCFLPLSSAR